MSSENQGEQDVNNTFSYYYFVSESTSDGKTKQKKRGIKQCGDKWFVLHDDDSWRETSKSDALSSHNIVESIKDNFQMDIPESKNIESSDKKVEDENVEDGNSTCKYSKCPYLISKHCESSDKKLENVEISPCKYSKCPYLMSKHRQQMIYNEGSRHMLHSRCPYLINNYQDRFRVDPMFSSMERVFNQMDVFFTRMDKFFERMTLNNE